MEPWSTQARVLATSCMAGPGIPPRAISVGECQGGRTWTTNIPEFQYRTKSLPLLCEQDLGHPAFVLMIQQIDTVEKEGVAAIFSSQHAA
jgi:hypothetical protein